MLFAHDTTAALLLAADLVNSDDLASSSELDGAAALVAFLGRHQLEPRRAPTAADLAAVAALRPRLRAVWQVTGTEDRAGLVNDLLRDAGARPRLVDHGGGWGWHLHVTAH
ncbi:MAG TPA: ABATE domain-containing protein, partial [Streptosporangiaceae bacterium]|nr:ABATE domain-containing protein [Streptosporangiaceae bacterium]